MLIGSDGTKFGLIDTKDALEKAKQANMDLVQVSASGSNPLVCKILDYGKLIFEKKKNVSNSRTKVKKHGLKEIKFRPTTDINDYNIKLKKIKSFIIDGDKT